MTFLCPLVFFSVASQHYIRIIIRKTSDPLDNLYSLYIDRTAANAAVGGGVVVVSFFM